MINGRVYDWESLTVLAGGVGTLANLQSIEYSDGVEVEPAYGKGIMPRGYGMGKYKGEGKAKLLKAEFDTMIDVLGGLSGGTVYGIPPVTFVAAWGNADQPTTGDTLMNCKIKSVSQSHAAGDTEASVEIEFVILDGIKRGLIAPAV